MRLVRFVFLLAALTSVYAAQTLNTCCGITVSKADGRVTELQVSLTNLQDEPLLIHQTLAEWDLRVQIKDASGQQAPFTDYGRRMATTLRSGSMRKHVLDRGERFSQSLDLAKLYQLTSGSYTVIVFRDVFVDEKRVELQTTTTIRIP